MAKFVVLSDVETSNFGSIRAGEIVDDRITDVDKIRDIGTPLVEYQLAMEGLRRKFVELRRVQRVDESALFKAFYLEGYIPTDGGGGGGLELTDYTIVESVNDLPAPSGGTSTLTPGVWRVNGQIAMGSQRILVSKGAFLTGELPERDQLLFTSGIGPFITYEGDANDERHSSKDLTVICTQGDQPAIGTTGTPKSLFFTRVNLIGCLGELTAEDLIYFDSCAMTSVNSGLKVTGSPSNVVIRQGNMRGGPSPTGPLVDISEATLDLLSLSDVQFSATSGQFALKALGANQNLSAEGRGEVGQCRFNGPGGSLEGGVAVSDLKWLFVANPGIGNSVSIAHPELVSNATTTVANGTFEIILGTFSFDAATTSKFTVGADGLITYIGLNPRPFMYSATINAQMASGPAKEVSFQVWKTPVATGTPEPISQPFTTEVLSNTPRVLSVQAAANLVTGDALQLRLRNNADGIGVTVINLEGLVTQIASGV